MTTKAGGLIRDCAPRRDKNKWSTFVATRCTQGSPEKRAHVRRERHPSRQDGRRPTRDNQGSPTKTHARPELTPPLEALKVVLSEVATGTRGGKVVALVDVRRAYFHAPARRRVFVEPPPEDYQPGDVRVVVVQSVLHARRCTKLGRGAGIYTQQSKTDERKRVLLCVERSHQGRGHCCNRAWR